MVLLLRRIRQTIFSWRKAQNASLHPRGHLYFLHLRKTAGTTLSHLLSSRFPAEMCKYHAHLFPEVDVTRFEFIEAHAGFEMVSRFHTPVQVITVLRDPVDRAISFYYYCRELASHPNYRTTRERWSARRQRVIELAPRLSLKEFLRQEPELADEFLGNEQTRALAGRPNGNAHVLVQQACENLEKCLWVGLTERFDESVQLLCQTMGWQPFAEVPRQNATSKRLQAMELDSETKQRLEDLIAPDREVYRFSERLFTERLRERERKDFVPCPTGLQFHLPEATEFSFAQPFHGAGWHSRENDAAGWYCWSGASENSWLVFPAPPKSDYQLRLELAYPPVNDIWRGLEIKVGTKTVALESRSDQGQHLAIGLVPAAAIPASGEPLQVTIQHTQRWQPSDVIPGSVDRRLLGIALRGLSLRPA